MSACRVDLFSIEHVESGATLILDALAKTALEHSGMSRVLRRECVEARACFYMTAVCAVVDGSDQSIEHLRFTLVQAGPEVRRRAPSKRPG